ncbi:helix-turn-helix domain-containing protein [Microbacterium sp. G2-8]|uniref:TetR/AcrR family transcriptional regulator n=1 Tax=Microbacterium sp. G2-8 TaxID=2842454 RepID=UPI0027E2F949|nr:helix-turn-helix domain-containing protein [Microbacterium sp. G2-8]
MANQKGRPGRPKAISRDMLAEAAIELFLEQGYDATSVAEIATRAGVGRSSFFNYAAGKADLLWGALDERIRAAAAAVDGGAALREALDDIARDFAPDALALAFAHADAMRLEEHLEVESALRMSRIAQIAARALRVAGTDPLVADVTAGAYGAAVLQALRAWSQAGAGASPFAWHLARALDVVPTR